MATIEDVAKLSGLSVATVSRVLNGSTSVRDTTADKVRRAIDELSYVPNLAARNLRRNESRVILTLAPNFTNPYYVHILAGIAEACNGLGYSMLHCTADSAGAFSKSFLDMLDSHRADGAILLESNVNYTWLEEYSQRYPIVQCCEYIPGIGCPSLSIDNYKAAFDSVSYLLGLGHRRIATISSVNNYISTRRRLDGYRAALEAAGIAYDPELAVFATADYSFTSGADRARQLMSLENPPTAIFCISDILALSTIAAAEEAGLNVPRDLTVMGFDDVDYTTMFHPYLTTVKQPCYELGRDSVKTLYDMIISGELSGGETFLPHSIISRESAAAPAGR